MILQTCVLPNDSLGKLVRYDKPAESLTGNGEQYDTKNEQGISKGTKIFQYLSNARVSSTVLLCKLSYSQNSSHEPRYYWLHYSIFRLFIKIIIDSYHPKTGNEINFIEI